PATLNAYSYAGGNPILYSDPSGRCFDGISTVVCAIAFGAGIGAEFAARHFDRQQVLHLALDGTLERARPEVEERLMER
ncbi:MAG: hypothetical protein M1281_06050, partial [Chloroflexi bacterium]|nr:hypothetical protein [Chloroflexota bacterium]